MSLPRVQQEKMGNDQEWIRKSRKQNLRCKGVAEVIHFDDDRGKEDSEEESGQIWFM